jgi:hypothetical protein
MSRKYGITTNTYKKFVIDSGAVYKNYGESGEALLGATRGGNSFVIETELREMPVDGAKGSVKGDKRITRVVAKITANFVEINPAILQLANPGSVVADYPVSPATKTHDSVTRALQIALTDYVTNIAIVGEVTGNSAAPFIGIIKNALAEGNFELTLADSDEGVISITFMSHFDPSALDTEPWEMRWPVIS